MAVGLISWLSLRSGRSAVNQVAADLSHEISQRIHDQLKTYLEVPHIINQLNSSTALQGEFDLANTRSLELRFWRQIQLYDSLSSIGFGSQDGRYVAADRRGDRFRLGHRDADSVEGRLRMYETDERGNPVRLAYTGGANYDPRVRPWYQLGQQAPEGRWSDIFTYSAQPIFVISAVRALQDENGTFQGVVISDLMLSDINEFLKGLQVGHTGETFILERSGALIATSTDEPPYRIVKGEAQRMQATEAKSPLLRASAHHLLDTFGSFDQIRSLQETDFELDNQRTFLQILPYVDPRGLDWLIVVAVPESDFTAPISNSQQSIVVLGFIIMLTAIGVGLITARWLVRPIAGLAAATTAIADGEWDGTVSMERDDEIGLLANAFDRMASQLRSSLETISAREASLAEAQKTTHLGSWEYDLAEQRLTCSDELFRLYGLEPIEASLEQLKSYERVHPDDREWVKATIEQALTQAQAYEIDHRILTVDNQTRYVQSKGYPLLTGSGEVKSLFGTVLDITERKAADAERKRLLEREQAARQEAELANQAKDQFLAILSHELRNPLNPILGWTRLLRANRLDPEKTAQALETIERNANLQVQLIDDILDVSRILRGKLTLTLRPLDLIDVVTAGIEAVQLAAAGKSIQIKTRLEPTTLPVEGDSNRLQQVITNLLTNAIKFTPDGGEVEVTTALVGSDAQVQVRDTGKGIEAKFLPHIFEHFQQADSTTTRESGGLGLGLAIVKHLTEMQGGTVTADSAGAGRGATFTLRLPCLTHQLEESRGEAIALPPQLKGLRILIVDDNPDNLGFLATLLQETGAIATAVTSGEAALAAIDQDPPDLLLSDIAMPSMDGYELVSQVRSLAPSCPHRIAAIALTAHAGSTVEQRVLAAGFDAYLVKPIDAQQLLETITGLIPRLNDEPRPFSS
ncbi:MAG: response regulator [Cyanobacteria bacterium Co-bin13]|nr:response regulator [Cyanobacteria bacterium Co-bin13]